MAENAIVPYEINALTEVSQKKKNAKQNKNVHFSDGSGWKIFEDSFTWKHVIVYFIFQYKFSTAWILGDALVYLSHKNSTEL